MTRDDEWVTSQRGWKLHLCLVLEAGGTTGKLKGSNPQFESGSILCRNVEKEQARKKKKVSLSPRSVVTYMFLSVRSSKLYPRMRWWVSEARTVLPSLRHHRHCTRTPSHESSRFPSRSWEAVHSGTT